MPEHVTLYDFLSGAVAFGFFVCALFFLRFWRRTRDELFIAFALAFALLGGVQATLALANIPTEERGSIYLFRLAAFIIILIAISGRTEAQAFKAPVSDSIQTRNNAFSFDAFGRLC